MNEYDVSLDLESRNSLSLIVGRIQPNSLILEFGPANGRLTKYLKEDMNCKVYCVEIDNEAAKDAEKYAEKILVDSIENYNWCDEFKGIKFDFIIFADVLEHLYYPKKVLAKSKEFLNDSGSILISIPNIAHNAILMDLFNGNFTYRSTGLLDKTHIRFFTKKTLDNLISSIGLYKIYEAATYENPKDTEFGYDYDSFSQDISFFLKNLNYGEVYQFIYELKLSKDNKKIVSDLDLKPNGSYGFKNQLFIDVGNGFNEEDSIRISFKNKSAISFDLLKYKNIKALRFDPLDNFVVLKVNSIVSNKNIFKVISSNAFYVKDNIYYFDSKDSRMYLDIGEVESIENILFDLEYLNIGEDALNQVFGIFRQILRIKEQQFQEKEQQFQEKENQLQEKEQQFQEKENQLQEKDQEIQHLHEVAQSMRIKNRIKNITKKVIPSKIWKIIVYIKHNPSSLKQGLYTLKNGGFIALVQKIKKVNTIPEDRLFNVYDYVNPILTKEIKSEISNFSKKPLISIIMPVYNVDPKWLDLAIKSVEKQWYDNWELCIVDDKSTNQKTIDYLKSIDSPKLKIRFLEKNLNISGVSNEALILASGEYIALMDNDDEITLDALYEVVKAINEHDSEFIYSDEDKLEMDGTFSTPHFKPNFAPDMILSQNYISHLGVIKKSLIDKVNGFSIGLEGAQDYDLYLKVLEQTEKIYHVQKVLYHWRKIPGSTAAEFSDKSYAGEAGRRALENTMLRRKIKSEVLDGKYPGTYRIKYSIKNNPLVSIVIPFKDKSELLKMCIESILNKSTYQNFEIIGISNNSTEKGTFDEMERLTKLDVRVQFHEYNVPFNYSQINNYAVNNYAKGEHIILLNNDIEIITPEWIEELLMYSQRDEIGVVGAKLYYPNNTIQHAGVIVGIGGIAGHSHKYFDKNDVGYFSRLHIVQNISAVTAACFMVKKSIYDELAGLNEKELKIAFNDVDFCLRVREKGYLNIFTPYCEAYHHESISRGLEDTKEKQKRFRGEVEYMQNRHKTILENGDLYYNSNLTLDREDFSIK